METGSTCIFQESNRGEERSSIYTQDLTDPTCLMGKPKPTTVVECWSPCASQSGKNGTSLESGRDVFGFWRSR